MVQESRDGIKNLGYGVKDDIEKMMVGQNSSSELRFSIKDLEFRRNIF